MAFTVPTDFAGTAAAFEPIPADNHVGVCVGVIELGTHEESFQGGPPRAVRKIKIQFELPGVVRADGKAGTISSTYNYSMNEKATFRRMLDAWLGGDWTERFKGRRWDFLIGLPGMVNVESGPGRRDPGRTFAWVRAVNKFPKGLDAPRPTREPIWLELDAKHLPETLNVWDAEKIRRSAEYRAGGFTDLAPRPESAGARHAPAPSYATAAPAARPPAPWPGATVVAPPAKGCPAAVAPYLAKYGLGWPFRSDEIPEEVDDADLRVLERYGLPF